MLTHLYISAFLAAVSLPILLTQQCQLVLTCDNAEIRSVLENLTEQINGLNSKLDRLHLPGSHHYPSLSCADLLEQNSSTPSGYYWVRATDGHAVRVYCDMTRSCGGVTGGWMRAAELDMTNSSQHCPSGLRQRTDANIRTCEVQSGACSTVNFNLQSIEYSSVCGKIRGYQVGSTDSFGTYRHGGVVRALNPTIEQNYVDGISLTHGHPRQHIWTFASALDEIGTFPFDNCPCINTNQASRAKQPPAYVGNDYFCDTASVGHFINDHFYGDDPLWDGAGCGPLNTCCSFNNPPWFYKQLPQPTTDDIEMRVCRDQLVRDENVAIEIMEIYVQ